MFKGKYSELNENSLLVYHIVANKLRQINNKKTVTFLFLLSSQPKTITMQTKKWISIGFIAAILIASLLMLNTSNTQKEKATCCKKSEKECPGNIKTEAPAETTLENLSHQFISFQAFMH
jgi:hypothetical protein